MADVVVRIPGPLRPFTGGAEQLLVPAGSIAEIVARLGEAHPQLRARLLTAEGELRPHVNIFIGRRNVRDLHGLASAASPGDVVTILPAVAGG